MILLGQRVTFPDRFDEAGFFFTHSFQVRFLKHTDILYKKDWKNDFINTLLRQDKMLQKKGIHWGIGLFMAFRHINKSNIVVFDDSIIYFLPLFIGKTAKVLWWKYQRKWGHVRALCCYIQFSMPVYKTQFRYIYIHWQDNWKKGIKIMNEFWLRDHPYRVFLVSE